MHYAIADKPQEPSGTNHNIGIVRFSIAKPISRCSFTYLFQQANKFAVNLAVKRIIDWVSLEYALGFPGRGADPYGNICSLANACNWRKGDDNDDVCCNM